MIQNSGEFIAGMRAFLPKVKQSYNIKLARIAAFVHAKTVARTPVHTGQTVANWQWSLGSPSSGVVSFSEAGETGRTNKMSLGSEPRRSANENIADSSLKALPVQKLFGENIWFVNNAPRAGDIERGELPPAPLESRSPAGMLGITVEDARARLKAGSL